MEASNEDKYLANVTLEEYEKTLIERSTEQGKDIGPDTIERRMAISKSLGTSDVGLPLFSIIEHVKNDTSFKDLSDHGNLKRKVIAHLKALIELDLIKKYEDRHGRPKYRLLYRIVYVKAEMIAETLEGTQTEILTNLFSARANLIRNNNGSQNSLADIDELVSFAISVFGKPYYDTKNYRDIGEDTFRFLKDDLDRAVEISKAIKEEFSDERVSELSYKLREIKDKVKTHIKIAD